MTNALLEAATKYDDQRFLSKSEIRIAANKKRRMKIVRRQKMALLFAFTTVILLIVFGRTAIKISAQSDLETPLCKYYTVMDVHFGDNLWSIAREYYCSEKYADLDSYINEIKKINRLESADDLKAGENLIVPYYAPLRR